MLPHIPPWVTGSLSGAQPRSPRPGRGVPTQAAAAGLCRPGGGEPAAPQSLASPLPPGAVLNMSKITSILCFPPPPRSHTQTRSAGPPGGNRAWDNAARGGGLCAGREAAGAARTPRPVPRDSAGTPGRAVPAGLSRYAGHGRCLRPRPVARARPPLPPRRGRCQAAAAASPPGGPCARRRPGRRFPLPPLA